ncbi:TadE family protein [Vibrio neonatus]|uniref:TadE family protein n=1 Tax=Vibrio neonatus TaxID=278860 RepID=UPI0021C497F8|nr:TadE/TadG family type IV pilus assembly protein [Vibrio neonatus]
MKHGSFSCFYKKNRGLAVIEFTIVSTVLLIALFAIMEFARFVFSLQMLNEVTRKSARLASVCYVTEQGNIPSLASITAVAPSGYEPSMLSIDYLDGSGQLVDTAIFNSGSATVEQVDEQFEKIRFVRTKIENFSFGFSLLSSLLGSVVTPNFETIVPAESLGIYRPIGEMESVPSGSTSCL